MFAILSIAFRSYFLPILILSALPFGFCGAVLGHIIFGKGLSMISYWGIGAACGVVVNDNLVLVDSINRLKGSGKHILECIVESGVTRFRPIIITSITTNSSIKDDTYINTIDDENYLRIKEVEILGVVNDYLVIKG